METRDSIQQTAANQLKEFKRLLCEWATGVGKSNVALKFLKDNPGIPTLILVPEQNNIQNWIDEFDKFGVPLFGVEVACYASLHKYKDTEWGLLVLDEAPHTDTELRADILATVKAEYVLALGAVIDDDERRRLRSLYGKFMNSTITLKYAIGCGFIPSPTVYVAHMRMSDKDRARYEELNTDVKKAVAAFNSNATEWNKLKMHRTGGARKRFLGEQKEHALRYITDKLNEKNRRFLCFCATIEQAERLGGELSFTSKTPSSMKLLDRFNNHEINSLYVVGKLIEGQNLKDIDCGIIGQLGGTKRITVQEIGRIIRSENPVVYVPVFDDTKDDSFLYTVTSSVPDKYIKHYRLQLF